MIAFHSPLPSSVREYSTRGGISAKDSRCTKPSFCSFFRVSETVFGLTICSCFMSSLNRALPQLPMTLIIKSAHFLPITSIMPSSGQECISSFSMFSRFPVG